MGFSCWSKEVRNVHLNWERVLTKASNTIINRLVLLVILLQRKQTNENGQNLINWDLILVSHNHAGNTAASVV